jgi:hypothetical protein
MGAASWGGSMPHQPWCDVAGHEHDIATTGAGPEQC